MAIYAALLRGISLYFIDARGGPTGMLRSIPANLVETNLRPSSPSPPCRADALVYRRGPLRQD